MNGAKATLVYVLKIYLYVFRRIDVAHKHVWLSRVSNIFITAVGSNVIFDSRFDWFSPQFMVDSGVKSEETTVEYNVEALQLSTLFPCEKRYYYVYWNISIDNSEKMSQHISNSNPS